MNGRRRFASLGSALGLLLGVIGPVAGQDALEFDEPEGCKDSPLLSRMSDCRISACSKSDFDTTEVLAGPYTEAAGDFAFKKLEGAWEKIEYGCLGTVSKVAIGRNAETALKQAGYTPVFSLAAEGPLDGPAFTYRNGSTWVEVIVSGSPRGYQIEIVREKAMTQVMAATAEAFAAAVEETGRVAVYGILFKTNEATIEAASEPVLQEVQKLLVIQPEARFRIEGHTDATGAAEANLKLSAARAAAVVAWLTAHGVPANRLTAEGHGAAKPVADNTTEEGRAKNRRVELVRL